MITKKKERAIEVHSAHLDPCGSTVVSPETNTHVNVSQIRVVNHARGEAYQDNITGASR